MLFIINQRLYRIEVKDSGLYKKVINLLKNFEKEEEVNVERITDEAEFLVNENILFVDHKRSIIKPIEGSIDLIKKLKSMGFKLAVASSSPKEFVLKVLRKLNIINLFDAIVTIDDVEKGKLDPEIFLKVARLLGVNPTNCIVIEDGKSGVIAAKRAGMKCIFLSKDECSNADIVVNSLKDIVNIIISS